MYSECVLGLLVCQCLGSWLEWSLQTHMHMVSHFPLSLESLPQDFGLGTLFWEGLSAASADLFALPTGNQELHF